MRPNSEIETPWLRHELLEHLAELSDPAWLSRAIDVNGRPNDTMDPVLDFFDDTGVVEEPGGRIGYILLDQNEADALATLGVAVGEALENLSLDRWQTVAAAAREALAVLRSAT
jgi:hypothetical protein